MRPGKSGFGRLVGLRAADKGEHQVRTQAAERFQGLTGRRLGSRDQVGADCETVPAQCHRPIVHPVGRVAQPPPVRPGRRTGNAKVTHCDVRSSNGTG